MRHASVVDLLAPEQRGGGGGGGGGGGRAADDFVAVSAPELSDALSLLATAQRRSANWSVAPGGAGGRPMLVATAGRASVVPRLTLVRDV